MSAALDEFKKHDLDVTICPTTFRAPVSEYALSLMAKEARAPFDVVIVASDPDRIHLSEEAHNAGQGRTIAYLAEHREDLTGSPYAVQIRDIFADDPDHDTAEHLQRRLRSFKVVIPSWQCPPAEFAALIAQQPHVVPDYPDSAYQHRPDLDFYWDDEPGPTPTRAQLKALAIEVDPTVDPKKRRMARITLGLDP